MPRVFLLRRCAPSLQKARDTVAQLPGWQVNGAAQSVSEACELIERLQPDIVACDLNLSHGRFEKFAHACRSWPERPQILLLTDAADDLSLFDALRWGADAYSVETGDGRGLMAGLRRLVAGRATMSPRIAQSTLALFGVGRSRLTEAQPDSAARDVSNAPGSLTPGLLKAEQHLLSLLAHGLLTREICKHWQLDEAEIERRLAAVYKRMHALLHSPEPERLSA